MTFRDGQPPRKDAGPKSLEQLDAPERGLDRDRMIVMWLRNQLQAEDILTRADLAKTNNPSVIEPTLRTYRELIAQQQVVLEDLLTLLPVPKDSDRARIAAKNLIDSLASIRTFLPKKDGTIADFEVVITTIDGIRSQFTTALQAFGISDNKIEQATRISTHPVTKETDLTDEIVAEDTIG